MIARVISEPAIEPISIDSVKAHSRIDHDADDVLLAGLIRAARQRCEGILARKLITQTVRWLPEHLGGIVTLPYPNVQSASFSYYDTGGTLTAQSSAEYRELNFRDSANAARIEMLADYSWPCTDTRAQPWIVDMVCGYGDSAENVPEEILLGMKILIAQWYENREAGVTGTIYTDLPFTINALWATHKWRPTT